VETYEDLITGGKSGPAIIPGDAENSLVITKIADGKHPATFESAELEKIIEWINGGATK
jgi:hypothetical protein